ncbi:hypothetical protein LX87_04836 [Larkinella arboricola]|uniref:Uncharacterized protein n=1 Tax=Larkinella arboricola TaxID=643671 RepID=A0A327WUD9_LARAB|nr:hypothetical protein LX87_04836 [Larkinella arboricola]
MARFLRKKTSETNELTRKTSSTGERINNHLSPKKPRPKRGFLIASFTPEEIRFQP